MDKLLEEIKVEEEQINKTMDYLKQVLSRKEKNIIELAATGTFIHNIYNGCENVIKRILKYLNKPIPVSYSWHKDILQSAVDNKILTNVTLEKLDEYRAFRHFFNHGYGIGLTEEKLLPLAENISKVLLEFRNDYTSFLNNIIKKDNQ